MICEAVQSYLSTAKGLPFFYAVGDDNYHQILCELEQNGARIDRISDFCPRDDKFPDIDDVIDHFRTLDVDCHQNKHVLIGLGEYLALRGSAFVNKVLRRLDKTTLGNARVVLLLRCVTQQVNELSADDARMVAQRRLCVEENAISDISITCTNYASNGNVAVGIKGLLRDLENGASGKVYVTSELDYQQSIMQVSYIRNAFAAIQQEIPNLNLTIGMGTADQWDQLYNALRKYKGSIDALFDHYDLADNFEEDIYEKCVGHEFKNWLYFISLKHNREHIPNDYLRYVVDATNSYEDLKTNILQGIIKVPRTDKRFQHFYSERKRLVKSFPPVEINGFIFENRINPKESIYRLTDNTKNEREEIIGWIAQNGYIDEISDIYPALAQYMGEYVFDCGNLSSALTAYFKQYRQMKLTNRITPDFLSLVEKNAKELPYTHLGTRDAAIKNISDKKNTFLYWIDALGVEYLPYFVALANKKGLSLDVDIVYVSLPTITSINKGFYDAWPGDLKEKESRLDDLKHNPDGSYIHKPEEAPYHLASELDVIKDAVDRAVTELSMHKCKKFVIASDHGASRLAVIRHQEEKYETDTKGEHSGRCCKEFAGADLPFAIHENGYLVLGDYGRFKNSRAANVEVHGGASLEEVVVPIITLSLKKHTELVIQLIEPDEVYCDRHAGTTIHLYISDVEHSQNVSVLIGEKRYVATCIDKTHYDVLMADVKRAKKNISASVYDGDDVIGTVTFDIKGKMAAVNNDFDDLF